MCLPSILFIWTIALSPFRRGNPSVVPIDRQRTVARHTAKNAKKVRAFSETLDTHQTSQLRKIQAPVRDHRTQVHASSNNTPALGRAQLRNPATAMLRCTPHTQRRKMHREHCQAKDSCRQGLGDTLGTGHD